MANHAVKTEWTSINAEGFDGYLALPPSGSGPGLLLWQEIFGVNAHIRGVAEQYALAGFVVLAPDVFWRSQRRARAGLPGRLTWLPGGRCRSRCKPDDGQDRRAGGVAALRARAGDAAAARAPSATASAGGWPGSPPHGPTSTPRCPTTAAASTPSLHSRRRSRHRCSSTTRAHDDHIPPESIERVRTADGRQAGRVLHLPGSASRVQLLGARLVPPAKRGAGARSGAHLPGRAAVLNGQALPPLPAAPALNRTHAHRQLQHQQRRRAAAAAVRVARCHAARRGVPAGAEDAPTSAFRSRRCASSATARCGHGQKTWNGVAILARDAEPIEIRRGLARRPDRQAGALPRSRRGRRDRRLPVRAQRQSRSPGRSSTTSSPGSSA